MCMSDPPQQPAATPPPAETPRPLASPYPDDDEVGSLSQLRIGTRSNKRRMGQSVDGDGAAAAPTGDGASAGDGRMTIPRVPPRGAGTV